MARPVGILGLVPGLFAFMSCPGSAGSGSGIQAPAFSIASGTYETDQVVEISCRTAGALIHYTTDRTDPTLASPLYAGPLNVEGDCSRMLIRAIAVVDGEGSSVSSLDVSIVRPPLSSWRRISDYKGEAIGRLCWGNDEFVALSAYPIEGGGGGSYRGEILRSADAASWKIHDAPWYSWACLTFGGGLFIAAQGNHIYASADAESWAEVYLDVDFQCNDLAYGGGTYIAVGDRGLIYSSHDGRAWARQARSVSGDRPNLNAVAYDPQGLFLVVGDSDQIWSSSDLIKWSAQQGKYNSYYQDVSCGAGTSVATDTYEGGVDFAGGLFFRLTCGAKRGQTSLDGKDWVDGNLSASGGLGHVAFGGGVYVASMAGGMNGILTSKNGVDWEECTEFPGGLKAIAACDSRFVAVGLHGELRTSEDGSSWRSHHPLTAETLCAVAAGGGVCVAGGSGGALLRSDGGAPWALIDGETTKNVTGLTYGKAGFVAVTDVGTILCSSNGISWAAYTPGVAASFSSVVSGNGVEVAAGSRALLVRSGDSTWSDAQWIDRGTVYRNYFAAGHFVQYSDLGYSQSDDGLAWRLVYPGSADCPICVAEAGEHYIGAGGSGILASRDGLSWAVCRHSRSEQTMGVAFAKGISVAIGPTSILVSP